MACNLRSRAKSSKGSRVLVAAGLAAAFYHVGGPTFTVKGGWDGQLVDIRSLPKGLGVESVSGVAAETGVVNLAVEDGHLVVRYADGPLSLRTDDKHAWQANFTVPDTVVRARGNAFEDLIWEISRKTDVKGLGGVLVNVSSGQSYGVSVVPSFPELWGIQLNATAKSHGSDIQARIEAQHQIANDIDLTYVVENKEGNYDLDKLTHSAQLKTRFGNTHRSSFDLRASVSSRHLQYNATFTRNLSNRLQADADAIFGVDIDGMYGAFEGSRAVGQGLTVGYKVRGRRAYSGQADASLWNDISLSHELGKVTLSQSSDGSISALLESDVVRGPVRAQGRVVQSLTEHALPKFNVTLSQNLDDVLPGAEFLLGVDSVSLDGVYGEIAARRDLGNAASLEYRSVGRIKSLEHSLKVANDFGFAKLVKRPDAAPRLQLGYQFNA